MRKALKDFGNKEIGQIKKGTTLTEIQLKNMDVKSLEAAGFIEKEKKATTKKVDKK